jgi:ComF family protein
MSCASCAGLALPFATARARFLYGGQLAVAVQALKYRGSGHLAGPLGRCLGQEVLEGPSIDLIVPVPLHRRRLALRGYNQAALLARAAARTAQLPCYPVALQRTRDTASQAWLGIEERRQNVHGAFRATCPRRVAGQSVLLIDDVMTTGSTAAAAATALLEAGATEVHVLTLARAMP